MLNISKMYSQVVTGNQYDLQRANEHTLQIAGSGVLAKEMPNVEASFVAENHVGCCLHYAMYLLKLLHDGGIPAYFTITPEADGANHCSVLYFDERGGKHIADPVEDIKSGTASRYMCIEYDEFARQAIRHEVTHYDVYGQYGEEAFFGKFLQDCKLDAAAI